MSQKRDIEDEIRFHLEMRTEANIERGMSSEEARIEAERTFGDPEAVRRAGQNPSTGVYGISFSCCSRISETTGKEKKKQLLNRRNPALMPG